MRKKIFFVIHGLITVGIVFILGNKWGMVPPVGKLFAPFSGFWWNIETEDPVCKAQRITSGIQDKVQVVFDDRLVPHIFAQNELDLVFMQGYLHARFRLWQMEFQTHAAAGRVSEIIGDKAVSFDKYRRRYGMLTGAQRTLDSVMANPMTKDILTAYTAGINSYINSLKLNDYPVEYKILDYSPEAWTPLKCALLLKYMAFDLSGEPEDHQLTGVAQKYGKEVAEALFPNYPAVMEPIHPEKQKWDFEPLPIPTPPNDSVINSNADSLAPKNTKKKEPIINSAMDESVKGSNNWVVGATKSATGYPILANDPHLSLNLPSIWYECQLSLPNSRVYGVSLPGAPGIIIGFNDSIAWGVTNVAPDVVDLYAITFKDATHKSYWHDNQWKDVKIRIDTISVRGQDPVLDTVYETHHGPILNKDTDPTPVAAGIPNWHSLRWLAHQGSNEVLTFYRLNRAHNYQDYLEALKTYACPAQNFIFADHDRNIALWSNGKYVLRWKGQGKYVSDGSNPAYDWQGFIPHSHNPHTLNPDRDFLSSANQFPAGRDYPYYLEWSFESFERGMRINDRLRTMNHITPDSLRLLQTDNFNYHAYSVLPTLLSYLRQEKTLPPGAQIMVDSLRRWDFFNHANSVSATVFAHWWKQLVINIWSDELAAENMRYPTRDRTVQFILKDTSARWFDNVNTTNRETCQEIVRSSLIQAYDSLVGRFGLPISAQWRLANYKSTDILHIARLPGFGEMDLEVGGGAGIINATTERTGPSWRMVVALGPTIEAYGIYPGGQSGNPGSLYYDNLIPAWTQGNLAPIVFLKKPTDSVADKQFVVETFLPQ